MIHEEKKIVKIVEELSIYFFSLGATEISTHVSVEQNAAKISVTANYEARYLAKLERMERYLKGQHNDGLEDIYWELAGSGEPGESSQLLLVGMMIDSAEVSLLKDTVSVSIIKKL